MSCVIHYVRYWWSESDRYLGLDICALSGIAISISEAKSFHRICISPLAGRSLTSGDKEVACMTLERLQLNFMRGHARGWGCQDQQYLCTTSLSLLAHRPSPIPPLALWFLGTIPIRTVHKRLSATGVPQEKSGSRGAVPC